MGLPSGKTAPDQAKSDESSGGAASASQSSGPKFTGVRLSEGAISTLSILGGLALWEAGGHLIENRFFPPLSDVLVQMVELFQLGGIVSEIAFSVQNLLAGFAISLLAGLLIGVLMARVRTVEKVLEPYVYGLLTAPAVVFVPIYFTLFGLSRWAIIFLIVQYATFIIIVNVMAAVKNVGDELVEMAQVFGASSQAQVLRKIVIPSALPLVTAGVRLGFGRAVKGMINGELLLAVIGLGGRSAAFGRAFNAEGVLSVLLIVIVIAMVGDRLIRLLDMRLNGWLPSTYR